MKSDVEVFGEVGGENYFLPLSNRIQGLKRSLYNIYDVPPTAVAEYVDTFLVLPPSPTGVLFTQYETAEYLWLGERAA